MCRGRSLREIWGVYSWVYFFREIWGVNTLMYPNLGETEGDTINMPSYVVSSKEVPDDEGWTLVTHKMKRITHSEAPKRAPPVRIRVARRPQGRVHEENVAKTRSADKVVAFKKPSPTILWDFFPKHFQELATLPKSCHHIDTEREQHDIKLDVLESSTALLVKKMKDNCSPTITFSDADMFLGLKYHNRPLLVTGYACGTKVGYKFHNPPLPVYVAFGDAMLKPATDILVLRAVLNSVLRALHPSLDRPSPCVSCNVKNEGEEAVQV